MRQLRRWLALGCGAAALAGTARAQGVASFDAPVDPQLAAILGAGAIACAAIVWGARASAATRRRSARWSERLADMEARLEKADAVLSAHPGLVLVWEDSNASITEGWGDPRVLGGPAALASILSFAQKGEDALGRPVELLFRALGGLKLDDEAAGARSTLAEKVRALREHGVAFSGAVVTADGRSIDVDGRIAGAQVALWLTDPAVRLAEDGAMIGAVRERATDLHGSHAFLDRAPIPAWRRDAEGALIWANRAYAAIVEAETPRDVIENQIEIDPSARRIAEIAARERKAQEGFAVVNVEGARRVFRLIESPLHGSGDATLGGLAIDATELDKAHSELKRHIAANERALDQMPSAIAIFGDEQNLVYCNASFQRLFAIDDAALSNRLYHGELLDAMRLSGKLPEPDDYDQWRRAQLALYENRDGGAEPNEESTDEIWRMPDARVLKVRKVLHPLGGVMMAIDDITEKASLEAQYNTQLKVQRATLNNLEEAIAVFGADGRLRLSNEAFASMWRLEPKSLERAPHVDAILSEISEKLKDRKERLDGLRRAVGSKTAEDRLSSRGIEVALKDQRTIAFGAEPLPDGATLIHFLDVTDSREREKELEERNAILEDADRLKSKFVDHVSYQLRTPLSAIIGFSEMLDGQMFGILNDRQKDYIASILTASYHLRDLINDIIDLAAVEAGQIELERKPLDIRALLANAATFSALKAEDTEVTLIVDCPADIGEAPLDERRVKQILFNLLSNAFAFSGAGQEVTIGARREENALRLWVSDTGRGISPDDQAKVFDAFESRGPSAGAGLGLSLVDRFVRLHGGWTKLEARESGGACVTCFFPLDVVLENAGDFAPPDQVEKKPATGAGKRKRRASRKRRAVSAQAAE